MEETPVTVPVDLTKWSTNKKIVVFSVVGVSLGLSIAAAFIPSANAGIMSVVKVLMDYVKVFI